MSYTNSVYHHSIQRRCQPLTVGVQHHCQPFKVGRRSPFSPGTSFSFTDKTNRHAHDIFEICLKMVLNIRNHNNFFKMQF